MNKYSFKKGFTLAEVLITLGIIGVIAALTIPNVTSHYRKKVVETRMSKFYSVINQAMKRSEVDNGPVKYWEPLSAELIKDEEGNSTGNYSTNTIEWYNKYLGPYLKVQKVKETNAFEGKVLVYFPDGSLLLFSSTSWLFYPEAKSYSQVEGGVHGSIDRKREDCGIKYFTFMFYPQYGAGGVFPYYQTLNPSDEELRNNRSIGCTTSVPSNERAYCTLLIARNGWKIPEDYPLKF